MTTLYKLLLDATGMSQAEAAVLHGKSLSTIKAWCTGRRNVPEGEREALRHTAENWEHIAQNYTEDHLPKGASDALLRRLAIYRPDLFTQPSATREP